MIIKFSDSTAELEVSDLYDNRLININCSLTLLPASVVDINVTGTVLDDERVKQFLAMIPPRFKTVTINGEKPIVLDDYWVDSAPSSMWIFDKGEENLDVIFREQVIIERLLEQLRDQKSLENSDDLLLLKKVKSQFANNGPYNSPRIDKGRLFNLLTGAVDFWKCLLAALLQEPVTNSHENSADETKKVLRAVKQYNAASELSTNVLDTAYCKNKIATLANNYPSSPAISLYLSKSNWIDGYHVNNAPVLAQLKKEITTLINSYKACNLTYQFNLFSRHGAAGRKRAEDLNVELAETKSVQYFSVKLVEFLSDPANGNYNDHSLRTMVLKGLLAYLHISNEVDTSSMNRIKFDVELEKLATGLSQGQNIIPVPVVKDDSLGWCSFGGDSAGK